MLLDTSNTKCISHLQLSQINEYTASTLSRRLAGLAASPACTTTNGERARLAKAPTAVEARTTKAKPKETPMTPKVNAYEEESKD